MATRKSVTRITKHTLNLFEGDYQRLQELYPKLGAGRAIREVVRSYLRRLESEEEPLVLVDHVDVEIPQHAD